ncbi:MAG TPA: DUF1800 domain-containing protein [Steroidobacteraceae bacterium]|nr:DUF1800 domain-containing protein [Steroidobacteraceae bacterium]
MPADGGGHSAENNIENEHKDAVTQPANQSDRTAIAGLAVAATLLAGCGGGSDSGSGNGSSSSANSSSSSAASSSSSVASSASSSSSAVSVSDAQAARFLLQAQFNASDNDIAAVKSRGYTNWINDQFALPQGTTGVAWLDAQGYNAIKSDLSYFWPQFGDFMIWNQLITAPDQMRKRVALAMSEYFVVSLTPIDAFWPPYMIAAYWDILVGNAFGNFRTLLEKITLNAAMGFFLNTRGNLKEDAVTGRQPDENYAREVMQLFTIGLYELNLDGSLKLNGSGNPIETYTQSDVTNLARVFTGYDYDYSRVTQTTVAWASYPIPSNHFALDPMRLNPGNHSNLAVNFLGTSIPANIAGATALQIALDTLFNHPNVGPFFAKQMIQRLVTSNPSPAYVQRVASAFNNNGANVRGDLKAVWKAILTDPEARSDPDNSNAYSGKLREPILRFVQWARSAEVSSSSGKFEIYDLTSPENALGQSALRSPSVFNFFRPGYTPPNSNIGTSNKLAPEFQIVNESTVAGYINFMEIVTRSGYTDVIPTYASLLSIAHDMPTLLAKLNLLLTANQLSPATINLIATTLGSFGVTATSDNNTKKLIVSTAFYLILCCPEYLVQK